jgi:Secretion system C-terminal sorting domain
MKSKIYILSFLFFAFIAGSHAQNAAARFKATMALSSPNSLMVALRSNTTFTGQFANVQFTFQIPSSVTPQPVISVKSNPLAPFLGIGAFVVTNEPGFTTYSYNVNIAGAPVYNFVAGTQFNALEVQFLGNTGATNVRLAHLPDGGITFQEAFYVEIQGNDNTDYASMFYGSGAVNDPAGLLGYSYLPLSGLVVPAKFTSFTAVKKDNDGLLNFSVENETSTIAKYEVERSIDGTSFEKINTLLPANNGATSNVYNTVDPNLSNNKNTTILYYRIKQIDVDGKIAYSEIRTIRLIDKGGFTAFPNPAKDFTTVRIDAEISGEAVLTLLSAEGKQIMSTTMQTQKGINLKKIDMSPLTAGNYIIKAEINGEAKTIAIIKL